MNALKKYILSVLYLLALLVVVGLSVRGLLRTARAETSPVQPACTIVIDPGHGGADGGAVGVTGADESALNLAIARRLQLILSLCGQRTVMTRWAQDALESPEADTIAAKKITDTKNRVALIEGVEDALLVSIHQNMFTQSRYSGAQVFWAPTAGSQDLAEHLQDVLREGLDPDNGRMAKRIDPGVYLMNHVTCMGILVECGFLSNYDEEARLQTETYQLQVAAAIAAGLLTRQAA